MASVDRDNKPADGCHQIGNLLHMKIALETRWLLDDEPLDTRILDLLRAIERTGSLAQGRGKLLSYRQAWAKLGGLAKRLGEPLVSFERGRGAKLTHLGVALLAADEQARKTLDEPHRRLVADLREVLAQARSSPASLRIVAHVSHDLALAALRDYLREAHVLELELRFKGSLEALDDLVEGRCDIAGFHMPLGRLARQSRPVFARRLLPKAIAIAPFATRSQGLMLPHGNPRRIRQLRDLARSGVRFINRQAGSGTRLLFDALLADEGISSSHIAGYEAEEFTHGAVAASVASGMADAGFGIEAAAHQAHLAFIPLARERYFLAFRDADSPATARLLAFLRTTKWRAALARYPGYAGARSGRLLDPATILKEY
jgi:putative molybdopterin biosynthesis protein